MPEERRKVLLVTFSVLPEPTGSSARATELLRGLTPIYQVDVLTTKTPDHTHIERFFGARLLRVPVGNGEVPARAQAFERAVRRQLESEEYELVHVTDPHGGYPVCELKGRYGYKVVYECQSLPSLDLRHTHPQLENDRRFLAKLRRQEIFCLMNAEAVVVTTQATVRYLSGMGIPEHRMHVIPPLADLELLSKVGPAPGEPEILRVLYLGRDAPWQGLPTLLQAIRLAGERCQIRARIAGPASGERRRLTEMARGLGLLDPGGRARVELSDPVPHDGVVALLQGADVGLAPLEAVPRNADQGVGPAKIAEYCAAGRGVLASDLPAVRELVDPGEQAVLVPPGDPQSLSRALVDLATHSDLRSMLGDKARLRARERFDADGARRTLIGIYRDLVDPSIIVSPEAFHTAASQRGEGVTATVEIPLGSGPPEPTQPSAAIPPREETKTPVDTNPGAMAPVSPSAITPVTPRPNADPSPQASADWYQQLVFGAGPEAPDRAPKGGGAPPDPGPPGRDSKS
jgi:glycosyltransferase involved in cell wall biosynthesis